MSDSIKEKPETPLISLTIDGTSYIGLEGERFLDVLERCHIRLPHLCYHPALGAIQSCDSCWVRMGGQLVRACTLRWHAGMEVSLDDSMAQAAREEGLSRIIGQHELYCTTCDYNNGTCEVHNTVEHSGIAHQRYPFTPKPYSVDQSNPFYRYDPSQCILCGRCVEACQNVQVNETLSIDWKADQPRVLWDGGSEINASSCVSCGHCVTVCPCNALIEKTMQGKTGLMTGLKHSINRPLINIVKAIEPAIGFEPIFKISNVDAAMRRDRIRIGKTVCIYCGVGCSFDVWTKDDAVLKIQPQFKAPANGISTCVKGKFGWDFARSQERLRTPLIREGDRFRSASWEEAMIVVAQKFTAVRERHGADALAFIASSKCSNEETYLMQKLARGVIGTNNIDNCSRYCQNPATTGLFRTVGYGGDSGSIETLQLADVVLIVGSNTADSHPVIASRIKRAQKLEGQKVIVADIRPHEMARRANIFIQPSPGTDLIWINAIARYILDQGGADCAFIARRVTAFEEYQDSLTPFTMEYAEQICHIPESTLVEVAEIIQSAQRFSILWAMGITQHGSGSDASTALSNLLLLTGNYGRPGTGAYPLRGHNNVQGAGDFGCLFNLLPGYQSVTDPNARKRFEQAWNVSLPERTGLNNHEMIEAMLDGRVRAMHVMGEELALVAPNTSKVEQALENVDFLVVQDLFLSRTAEFADVVLPAAASLEKEGTFTNTERRIQRFEAVLAPWADSRPDWRILMTIADAMGAQWPHYADPGAIMAEAASVTDIFAGVRYERLQGYDSLQWPVNSEGIDTPVLFEQNFPMPEGRAQFFPISWREPLENPDHEFDLWLNNGRLLEHFHEGNLTDRSEGLKSKLPRNFVELSPDLAIEYGVEDGTMVRLISRRGAIRLPALINPSMQGRILYMPMRDSVNAINRLTGDHTDTVTATPAYKELAVRMEILDEKSGPVLPRSHPRYGHPTPRREVEIKIKWQQEDYISPAEWVHQPKR